MNQVNWVSRDKDPEQWKLARSRLFTASDAAALLGQSKYKTRNELVMEKLWGRAEVGNAHMYRGQLQEDFILARAKTKFGQICHAQPSSTLFISSACPILGATPDAIGPDYLVEVKSKGFAPRYPLNPAKPPKEHYLQVQFQLLVTGFARGFLVHAHLGVRNSIEMIEIQSDTEVQQKLVESACTLAQEIGWL